jgi:alanyl-tRNA synthetase
MKVSFTVEGRILITERLYYRDARLTEFTASLVASIQTERGIAVQLDRTAFYPTSGGQPFDSGALEGVKVLDVWEEESGEIWHLLESNLEVEDVSGKVDWPRRFDHMQQHTGQHMLSAAFLEMLEAPTMSFHLGSEFSTVDLHISDLDWEAVSQVEAAVNRVVWENRSVVVHFIKPDEVADFPLRKPPQVTGEIRVVWVDGYDASACGGTHVAHTGEIGLIKVTTLERYKGGMRVGFRCGERALKDYQQVLRNVVDTSILLSIHPNDLRETVLRLDDEARQSRRKLKYIQGKLVEYEAGELWREISASEGVYKFSSCWDDRSFDEVHQLALRLREYPNTVVLFAAKDAKGIRLVCARSDDMNFISAGIILRSAAEALGGRGGGSATIAQGGAPVLPCAEVTAVLKKVIDEL